MKTTNRILSLLLAALMLLPILTGCGGSAENPPEPPAGTAQSPASEAPAPETDPPVTEPPEYENPGKNYQGETFTVAAVDYYAQGGGFWAAQKYCEAYTNETTGDVLNDAIFERNNKVSDTLNVKLRTHSLTGYEHCAEEYRTILMSGDTSVDFCLMNGHNLPTFLGSGMLQDLNTLERVDFSHSWWDQASVEEFTILGSLFAVTGDVSLCVSLSPITYFFNKKIIADNNMDDPYQLVREGRWTVDKSIEMSRAAAKDLNGDGKIEPESDRFGMAIEALSLTYAIHSSGVRLTGRDADGAPYIDVDKERASTVVDKLLPFYNDAGVTLFADHITGYSNVFKELFLPSLMENRLLFFNNQLLVAMDLREMDSDFGILPPPKLDEAQSDYLCPISTWWATFCILPKTNTRLDITSDTLEAMGFFSQQLVTPAFIEKSIQGKTLRDKESSEMLELILHHRAYEIAAVYDWGEINSMFTTMNRSGSSTFASTFEASRKSAEKYLKKYVSELKKSMGN